jgi:hypothetical protein
MKQTVDVSIENMTVGETCTYRAHSRCGYPAVDFDIQNDTLLQGFDIAFATNEGMDMTKDIGGWDAMWMSRWNGSFATNSTSRYLHEDISEGNYSYVVDDNTWEKCNGAPRNMWFVVTRVEYVNLTLASGDGQPTKYPDFEMMFYNNRGTKQPPSPPTPPPIPPPRPVPRDKNITVESLKFSDLDKKTFSMTEQQLKEIMRFPIHPGTATTLHMKGTWQMDVGKTGIQLSIYDTIAERTFFKNEYFSGRANFTKGETMDKIINFLVPTYIPQSIYEVRVGLINWINPTEEYAAITCDMVVDDINE